MAHSSRTQAFLVESRIAQAADGDVRALYELGIAYSTGSGGTPIDLVEAHKWFNLAAMRGNQEAKKFRSELAAEMTALQVAEAQRQAREWLATH